MPKIKAREIRSTAKSKGQGQCGKSDTEPKSGASRSGKTETDQEQDQTRHDGAENEWAASLVSLALDLGSHTKESQ